MQGCLLRIEGGLTQAGQPLGLRRGAVCWSSPCTPSASSMAPVQAASTLCSTSIADRLDLKARLPSPEPPLAAARPSHMITWLKRTCLQH